MANYLTYPFKTMRITQSYTGTTSHLPHTTGTPKDYPIDEGGKDTGRDPVYCPCDEMVVKRIYGVGNGGTNTIWLESTKKCKLANGREIVVALMLTHPNDGDLKKVKEGQKFKRGEVICYEGTDGASGNHIHLSVGMGAFVPNGWTKNSKGKYVITSTGNGIKPEQAFYVDEKFTKIVNAKGLKFKKLPKDDEKPVKKEEKAKYSTGDYKVTTDLLNVRTGAGLDYPKKSFADFTTDAKTKIKKLHGSAANGYVKGLTFTVLEVKNEVWGRTPSGWVCLDYCVKLK